MTAWHGDSALRDATLAHFREAVAQGKFVPDEHDDANGTLYHGAIYCLTGQQDAARFASDAGYPPAVAALLAPITQNCAPERSAEIVLSWLSAPTPGADLDAVSVRVLLETLEDADFAAPLRTTPDACALLDRLIALHRTTIGEAPAPRAEWRAFRKEAMALVEGSSVESRERLQLLETLAWPVESAPELLIEVLWTDADTRQARVAATRDMPPAKPGDETLIDRIMEAQLAAGLDQDQAFDALDEILDEQHPDFVARNDILSSIMDDVMPLAAEALSDRVVRHLSKA